MPPLLNPLPFALVIATTFGVLMHDTQVDHATTVAIVNPVSSTDYASAEATAKSNDQHVHVEKVSVMNQLGSSRTNNPRTQVRDDDHRYIQPKRLASSGGDSVGLWPSV